MCVDLTRSRIPGRFLPFLSFLLFLPPPFDAIRRRISAETFVENSQICDWSLPHLVSMSISLQIQRSSPPSLVFSLPSALLIQSLCSVRLGHLPSPPILFHFIAIRRSVLHRIAPAFSGLNNPRLLLAPCFPEEAQSSQPTLCSLASIRLLIRLTAADSRHLVCRRLSATLFRSLTVRYHVCHPASPRRPYDAAK